MVALTRDGERVRFSVRVTPRASANALSGERDGVLLVRVTAPPADGAANAAVIALLAKSLALPPTAVRIERGGAGRDKRMSVPANAAARLEHVLK